MASDRFSDILSLLKERRKLSPARLTRETQTNNLIDRRSDVSSSPELSENSRTCSRRESHRSSIVSLKNKEDGLRGRRRDRISIEGSLAPLVRNTTDTYRPRRSAITSSLRDTPTLPLIGIINREDRCRRAKSAGFKLPNDVNIVVTFTQTMQPKPPIYKNGVQIPRLNLEELDSDIERDNRRRDDHLCALEEFTKRFKRESRRREGLMLSLEREHEFLRNLHSTVALPDIQSSDDGSEIKTMPKSEKRNGRHKNNRPRAMSATVRRQTLEDKLFIPRTESCTAALTCETETVSRRRSMSEIPSLVRTVQICRRAQSEPKINTYRRRKSKSASSRKKATRRLKKYSSYAVSMCNGMLRSKSEQHRRPSTKHIIHRRVRSECFATNGMHNQARDFFSTNTKARRKNKRSVNPKSGTRSRSEEPRAGKKIVIVQRRVQSEMNYAEGKVTTECLKKKQVKSQSKTKSTCNRPVSKTRSARSIRYIRSTSENPCVRLKKEPECRRVQSVPAVRYDSNNKEGHIGRTFTIAKRKRRGQSSKGNDNNESNRRCTSEHRTRTYSPKSCVHRRVQSEPKTPRCTNVCPKKRKVKKRPLTNITFLKSNQLQTLRSKSVQPSDPKQGHINLRSQSKSMAKCAPTKPMPDRNVKAKDEPVCRKGNMEKDRSGPTSVCVKTNRQKGRDRPKSSKLQSSFKPLLTQEDESENKISESGESSNREVEDSAQSPYSNKSNFTMTKNKESNTRSISARQSTSPNVSRVQSETRNRKAETKRRINRTRTFSTFEKERNKTFQRSTSLQPSSSPRKLIRRRFKSASILSRSNQTNQEGNNGKRVRKINRPNPPKSVDAIKCWKSMMNACRTYISSPSGSMLVRRDNSLQGVASSKNECTLNTENEQQAEPKIPEQCPAYRSDVLNKSIMINRTTSVHRLPTPPPDVLSRRRAQSVHKIRARSSIDGGANENGHLKETRDLSKQKIAGSKKENTNEEGRENIDLQNKMETPHSSPTSGVDNNVETTVTKIQSEHVPAPPAAPYKRSNRRRSCSSKRTAEIDTAHRSRRTMAQRKISGKTTVSSFIPKGVEMSRSVSVMDKSSPHPCPSKLSLQKRRSSVPKESKSESVQSPKSKKLKERRSRFESRRYPDSYPVRVSLKANMYKTQNKRETVNAMVSGSKPSRTKMMKMAYRIEAKKLKENTDINSNSKIKSEPQKAYLKHNPPPKTMLFSGEYITKKKTSSGKGLELILDGKRCNTKKQLEVFMPSVHGISFLEQNEYERPLTPILSPKNTRNVGFETDSHPSSKEKVTIPGSNTNASASVHDVTSSYMRWPCNELVMTSSKPPLPPLKSRLGKREMSSF